VQPAIKAFFDPATFTYSYVVADPATGKAAIVDPVLDYDPASGKTYRESVDRIIAHVRDERLEVEWILETHVHADHLTGAAPLKEALGGRVGIGSRVTEVQTTFGEFLNAEACFRRDGRQFDHLFEDGESFRIGSLEGKVLHTPGHTPACVTYVIGAHAFVGDTLFMPDYGTARTDFPGGDAATLYRSIRRILDLPGQTRLYMCHDYGSETRKEFAYETTVAEERRDNLMIRDGVTESDFVRAREDKDAKLAAPRLLLPSVQFNMRAGHPPPAEDNGVHYLKIPLREAR